MVGIVAVAAFSTAIPDAQTGPNLSGFWTLATETIAKADGAAEYPAFFRLGSHLRIQQDATTFTMAAWTMPIDGDVVTDPMGVRWRAKRQADGISVTGTRGDAAAGTNSAHAMSFRLMADGRLSVEIVAEPVLAVKSVKSVYAKSPKDIVPSRKPDFAGRWIVDGALSQLNGSTAWFTNDIVVSMDAKGLTIAGSGPVSGTSFFPTDGSGFRTPDISGPRGISLTHVEWQGTQLIATTLSYLTATDRLTKREVLTANEGRVTIALATDGTFVVEVSVIPARERIGFATRSVYRRVKSDN